MTVRCAGAWVRKGESDALLRRASELDAEIVLMNAYLVCGVDHLDSAVDHARRAFERGTNASNTLGMEVILYASGEKQISKAKKKMGLSQETERVAVIVLGPEDADLDRVLDDLLLKRDDALLDCSAEKGAAFGIGPEELETAGNDMLVDLVMEKVAFVEILKR
ncbi:MAG: KEOPS complex subunit Cgi121 [Methanomassiliicoccales archaeon]